MKQANNSDNFLTAWAIVMCFGFLMWAIAGCSEVPSEDVSINSLGVRTASAAGSEVDTWLDVEAINCKRRAKGLLNGVTSCQQAKTLYTQPMGKPVADFTKTDLIWALGCQSVSASAAVVDELALKIKAKVTSEAWRKPCEK